MKKIFVALMAVLVMASCGGDKSESDSLKDFASDVLSMMENLCNEVDKAIEADDTEAVVKAFERFADKCTGFAERAKKLEETAPHSEVEKMKNSEGEYGKIKEDLEELGSRLAGFERYLENMPFTTGQARRIEKAMVAIQKINL